jgi:hypothetical protein
MGACRELDSGRVPRPRAKAAAALALTAAVTFAAASAVAPAASADPGAQAKPKKKVTLTVCKHGCRFRTITRAVRRVQADKRTTIKVRPGTYREGVRLFGRKFDGLKIMGTGATPGRVVLEGDRDGDGEGDIQNAIEAVNASHVKLLNMRAQNYATNGFFIHADPGKTCNGFLMKKLEAAFNRSYGLFARNCVGGRITRSEGWGHGDSAFYIGETPPQRPAKRRWTRIDHVIAHTNVLGYSGTNSKYVDIHDSYFFNNGAGVVPNTLDSERFEPSALGRIRDNWIFWNNFNYYMPDSPVQTVSGGLGEIPGVGTINYPTGAGVVLLGSSGWVISNNQIFGNAKWGVALLSDPFNKGEDALSQNNRVTGNEIGRNGTDTNATDFWNDGSGSGNCFSGNDAGAGTLTYGIAEGSTRTQDFLYPACPAPDPPDAGTGTSFGDDAQLFNDLIPYVTSDPPCAQQQQWTDHPHPPFREFEPLVVGGECA